MRVIDGVGMRLLGERVDVVVDRLEAELCPDDRLAVRLRREHGERGRPVDVAALVVLHGERDLAQRAVGDHARAAPPVMQLIPDAWEHSEPVAPRGGREFDPGR